MLPQSLIRHSRVHTHRKSQCRWATEPGACSGNLRPSCGWPGRLPESLSEPYVPGGVSYTEGYLKIYQAQDLGVEVLQICKVGLGGGGGGCQV